MQTIYFDHAATTPINQEVFDVLMAKTKEIIGNPSSTHALGQKARVEIEQARNTIAKLLGVSGSEIYFTSGATEAINMIIRGVADSKKIDKIIVSSLEHHAVLHALQHLPFPISIEFVDHNQQGIIDLSHLDTLLTNSNQAFVIIMNVNNEIGNINSVEQIASICKRHHALFFSDMVQAVGKTEFSLANVDFASFSAHKFNGPKGVGFAFIRSGNKIEPLLYGGSQEQNMRAGTENLPAIVAMAKALALVFEQFNENFNYLTSLKVQLVEKLKTNFPTISFNGTSEFDGVPNIINFTLPDFTDMEMLHILLDLNGVCISQGSACSSGSSQKSLVISALKNGSEQAIRISFGINNTITDINSFIEILKKIVYK
jgi:cysteine desulfurase